MKINFENLIEGFKKYALLCQTKTNLMNTLLLPLLEFLDFDTMNPELCHADIKYNEMQFDFGLFWENEPTPLWVVKLLIDSDVPTISYDENVVVSFLSKSGWIFKSPEEDIVINFNENQEVMRRFFEQLTSWNLIQNRGKPLVKPVVNEKKDPAEVSKWLLNPSYEYLNIMHQFLYHKKLSQKNEVEFKKEYKKIFAEAVGEFIKNSLLDPSTADESNKPMDVILESDKKEIDLLTDEMVFDLFNGSDVSMKLNETYTSLIFKNKPTRWLIRIKRKEKKNSSIEFSMPLTDDHLTLINKLGLKVNSKIIEINKREDIYKLSTLLFENLDYCMNEDNYKRKEIKTSEDPITD